MQSFNLHNDEGELDMIINWMRNSTSAAWAFLILRLWLGYEWLSAGWEKLGTDVWTGDKAGVAIGGFLKGAIGKSTGDHAEVHGWFGDFLQNMVVPNGKFFSYLVVYGEMLVGLGLILGGLTMVAAIGGVLMNMMYLWAGTSSTNPELLVLSILVLVAGANASKLGLDHFLRKWFVKSPDPMSRNL